MFSPSEIGQKGILRGKRDEPLFINGNEIEIVPYHTDLGKIIEEKGKY